MSKMSSVRRSTICALCIALCIVLPVAFHALGVGAVFLPMHIPVFLCALTCGWEDGIFTLDILFPLQEPLTSK